MSMRPTKPGRSGGKSKPFAPGKSSGRAKPATPGKPPGRSQRQLRAGELVRHALVEILRGEEVADPVLSGVSVTVTEVRTSPDLRHATVFVEPLGAGVSAPVVGAGPAPVGGRVGEMVAALNRAAPFLRGRLGHAIELKFTPTLHFVHDESFEAAAHMNALFADPRVARDLNSRESTDESEA